MRIGGQKVLQHATVQEVIENDRSYFESLDGADNLEVTGLDVAENAVAFGAQVGLLDKSIAINLENQALPQTSKRRSGVCQSRRVDWLRRIRNRKDLRTPYAGCVARTPTMVC